MRHPLGRRVGLLFLLFLLRPAEEAPDPAGWTYGRRHHPAQLTHAALRLNVG